MQMILGCPSQLGLRTRSLFIHLQPLICAALAFISILFNCLSAPLFLLSQEDPGAIIWGHSR